MSKILKFYADWCGPCKMLSKTLEGKDLGAVVEDIDIDKNTEMAVKYGVRGVPTMILVDDNGVEVDRVVGMSTYEAIKTKFNQ